ncbi:hypothetical protein C1637_09890 [Chryseobacterium lactis]|uniref:Uncharacterized protein n=1 Tax=Chryseobacterium lactis TaxID=1241981 RepID=A0A3G6RH88_CHRLC|nr:hypothetical protein [Chryseobacterium lactis]AZA82178.1 hypothetical protein EG342_09810 [Chryseobacterium lactis]AZB02559.1 hypothetical protein EG341_00665 [Chryseobacterium lactis]PNW14146.1 hypothetical protein C1637_09890 [Chryseobacterium lactis]
MLNPEQVEETIKDVEEMKAKILKRHQDNLTFCIRTESVFNQYVNSLSYATGTVRSEGKGAFKPQPLTSVLGKQVKTPVPKTLQLTPISISDEESFKETIQLLHDNLLNRDNIDLLDSLKEIEIRGVAKVAGLNDYREAKIDGAYIEKIKEKIIANQNLETEREAAKKVLNEASTGNVNLDNEVKTGQTDQKKEQQIPDPAETAIQESQTPTVVANQNLETDQVSKGNKTTTTPNQNKK